MSRHPDFLSGREFRQHTVHEFHEVAGLVRRNPADGELEIRSKVSEVAKLRSAYGDRNPPLLVLYGHCREPGRSGFAVLRIRKAVDHREALRLHLVEKFGALFGLVFPHVLQSGLQAEGAEFLVFGQRFRAGRRFRAGKTEGFAFEPGSGRDSARARELERLHSFDGIGLDSHEGFGNSLR